MKVTVCVGSSCHLKGSRDIFEGLKSLISENDIKDKVELGSIFCMNNCQNGVCVTVDEKQCSVTPDTIDDFFNMEILAKV